MNATTQQSMAHLFELIFSSMKFSGCKPCTAVDAEPSSQLFDMANGEYFLTEDFVVTLLNCSTLKFSCQYKAEGIETSVKNTEFGSPEIVEKALLPFVGGTGGKALCGSSTVFDAPFRVSTEGPIWLSLFELK